MMISGPPTPRAIGEPLPVLLPTHSPAGSSGCWRVACGVGTAVVLALLLLGALLVATSCTIQEITLYKTVHQAQPRPTPLVKIGPS